MQDGELLTHHPAHVEQRLSDRGQPRKACDELADPRLISRAADDADFQTKVAQRAAQVGLNVQQLALKQLAAGQQHALFLGADSDDVARSFRDHVARCSDMMSPA
jgi:hypothetical protein